MAVTPNSIVTPQGPFIAGFNLAAVTACATRAPTPIASAAAANIFLVSGPTANGLRLDRILVKGSSSSISATTAAQTVTIWLSDGATLWPIDEILVTAVIPSTTVASYQGISVYSGLVLPSTWLIYVSTSVTTTAATTALSGIATGAVL